MPTFAEDTAITGADGRYRAQLGPRWWGPVAPLGGFLAACIVRAMEAESGDPERTLRSLNIHFVAPPRNGEIALNVTLVRRGRSVSTATARAEQEGRLLSIAIGEFSAPRRGPSWTVSPMPDATPFADAPRVPADAPGAPAYLDSLELRWAGGPPPLAGASGDVELNGWMRAEGPGPLDGALLVCLSDAMPPVALSRASLALGAPTLDLTVHLFGELPVPGAGAETPVLGRFTSARAQDGLWTEDGELWTPDGRLVVQSRQLALIVPVRH
jgi:acyl-CoA thioesterase